MAKNNPAPPFGGLLNIRKPLGVGSMDVIRVLRKTSQIKKIGHVGTLDPFADGVLPIAVGRSTNMIRYMENYDKVYRVLFYLGQSTDTQDLTGIETYTHQWTREEFEKLCNDDFKAIREAIAFLSGPITQETPQYSAAKINGKKMYELARQGIEVKGKLRQVEIKEVSLISIESDPSQVFNPKPLDPEKKSIYFPDEMGQIVCQEESNLLEGPFTIVLDIHCSKGTYIRTWVNDLGKALGTGAYACKLRRVQAGPYTWDEAVTLEEITQLPRTFFEDAARASGALAKEKEYFLSPDTARSDLAMLKLAKQEAMDMIHGKRLALSKEWENNQIIRLYMKDLFIGLAKIETDDNGNSYLLAERMFRGIEDITN